MRRWSPAYCRHLTAVHEAGHAVLLHHHWRGLPEAHHERPPFHSVDVYREDRGRGSKVSSVCSMYLTPWAELQVNLAGPLAEDGAATTKDILDNPDWWDLDKHEPYSVDDQYQGSDHGKIRGWLDKNGCPEKVLQLAVGETAAILWEHRRAVHEIARRAYKAEFLHFFNLVDIWPDLAPAVAELERRVAKIPAFNAPAK